MLRQLPDCLRRPNGPPALSSLSSAKFRQPQREMGNGPDVSKKEAVHERDGVSKVRPKRARPKPGKVAGTEVTSRFHCDFCGRDLSAAIRARCAVCPDYDSCLDCFSVGAALAPHEHTHAYRLIEVVQSAIFQVGWSADEEDRLLEGLELYGVGNWEEVAKMIASKDPFETEQHFMKVFLQSEHAPLPDLNRILGVDKAPVSEKYDDVDPKALRVMHMHQQEDAAGWMDKRRDFLYEWDNEAEEILGDMELAEDDTKADKELKAQVLEIYASKLDERMRRKEFVLERNLTEFKAFQAAEKKRPKEERDLRDKLRVFARFLPQAEMDKFVKGILEERALRSHIDFMRDGRAHGASSLADCNRLGHQSAKAKTRNSLLPSDVSGPSAVNSAAANGSTARRNRKVNGDVTPMDESGSISGVGTASGAPGVGIGGQGGSATGGGGGSSGPRSDVRDRRGVVLGEADLELMPGAELLGKAEIAMCGSLKITPHQYMIVKDVLVRENARLGHLRKKDAKSIIRLDSSKVLKIYDYLQACGWIRTGASTSGSGAGSVAAAAARQHSASHISAPNGTRT